MTAYILFFTTVNLLIVAHMAWAVWNCNFSRHPKLVRNDCGRMEKPKDHSLIGIILSWLLLLFTVLSLISFVLKGLTVLRSTDYMELNVVMPQFIMTVIQLTLISICARWFIKWNVRGMLLIILYLIWWPVQLITLFLLVVNWYTSFTAWL
ncbi:hypothetical protein [Streptococcus marmotae]|uniref:hypothetical protein n=1 Tax=Streptococcus marmotae TaxID=1825069 RepID=UPI0008341076|nr:hypothetical protein [Streptococcus marmotae]